MRLTPLRPALLRAAVAPTRPVRPHARLVHTFYNESLAGLTSDQAELRDAVSSWAQSRVAPRAQEIDSTNTSPMDLWPSLGEMGLLGITVPEEYGGLGKGYLEHTIVMEGESCLYMRSLHLLFRERALCADTCFRP